MRAEICSVGHVVEDIIESDGSPQSFLGGAAYGIALNLARLEQRSGLASLFGDGRVSQRAWNEAQDSGVDLSASRQVAQTEIPQNTISHADRTRGWLDHGLGTHYGNWKIDASHLNRYESVSFASTAPGTLNATLEQDITPLITYSPGPKLRQSPEHLSLSALRKCHTLFVNEEEWAQLQRQLHLSKLTDIFTRGPEVVVVTLGEQGAFGISASGEYWHVPALPPRRLVDSTGAGDAFFIGYWLTWLKEREMSSALRSGALFASLSLEQAGVLLPVVAFRDLVSQIQVRTPLAEQRP